MAGGSDGKAILSDGKAILDPEQMEAEVVVVRDKHCPPEEEAEVVRATLRSVQTHATTHHHVELLGRCDKEDSPAHWRRCRGNCRWPESH